MEHQEPDMLLCEACSQDEIGGRIELGIVPALETTLTTKSGDPLTIRVSDETVFSIPTKLRRVVQKFPDGRCRLECGHQRMAMPLVSAQEQITLSTGEVVHGHLPV